MEFIDLYRTPDAVNGAVEGTPGRFEEKPTADCPVPYTVDVTERGVKVTVYPGSAPVKYLRLRYNGDLSAADRVLGDEWERSDGSGALITWQALYAPRRLPWYCLIGGGGAFAGYGVKTGGDAFAFWQVDPHGITLFLNLLCGSEGTDLREPITACEIVEVFGDEGEDAYRVARRLTRALCDAPVLPKEPVFGVNNWYWAYGNISRQTVLTEAEQLCRMTEGTVHRPYLIIDDGWQVNRTPAPARYIGGPWQPNEDFGDMEELCGILHGKGLKAGLWFRPLLTVGNVPEEARLFGQDGGIVMDPSHPYTLERVGRDAARIRSWGYDLIKHDFSTGDALGAGALTAGRNGVDMARGGRVFFDRTKTSAMILKNLYRAIQRGAGEADVIGCNTVGHLTAGIHAIQRTGADTSGRSFEWTMRNGVNTMMRLPQNGAFFMTDPDCAAFTAKVDPSVNLDFLEMCALTGVTTLASVTPGILDDASMRRIREIYRIADRGGAPYGIADYEKTVLPETFVSEDGAHVRSFDWYRMYDGSRSVIQWKE